MKQKKPNREFNLGLIAKDFELWVPTVELEGERLVYKMPRGMTWQETALQLLFEREKVESEFKKAGWKFHRRPMPGSLITEFTALEVPGNSSKTKERVLDFASKWGPLWACNAHSYAFPCIYSPESEGKFRFQHTISMNISHEIDDEAARKLYKNQRREEKALSEYLGLSLAELEQFNRVAANLIFNGEVTTDYIGIMSKVKENMEREGRSWEQSRKIFEVRYASGREILKAFPEKCELTESPTKLTDKLVSLASEGKLPDEIIDALVDREHPWIKGVSKGPFFSIPGRRGRYYVKPHLIPCSWDGEENISEWLKWSESVKLEMNNFNGEHPWAREHAVGGVNTANKLPYGPSVRLEFVKGEKTPRLGLNPGHGFLRVIFLQLAVNFAEGGTKYNVCDGCGRLYVREGRAAKRNQRNYCPECREGKAGNRLYMQGYTPPKKAAQTKKPIRLSRKSKSS